MPRVRRKLSISQIYHVMIRGNEKKSIFLDNQDRVKFVGILSEKKWDDAFLLYAWCLMDNHVHLLLKEGKENISLVMKRINVSYAGYFNKKYARVGHVFQDRFRSEPVDNEGYFLELIRYIHNNPIRAKIVDDPSKYAWSSYRELTGPSNRFGALISREDVLELFSLELRRAREMVVQHINAPDGGNETKGFDPFFQEFLRTNNLHISLHEALGDRDLRKLLIRDYKLKSGLSNRKIASQLGVGRNVIQRLTSVYA